MQNNHCKVVTGVIGAIKRWPPLPRESVLISLYVVGQMDETDVRLVKCNEFGALRDGLNQNALFIKSVWSTDMSARAPPLVLRIIINVPYNASFCAFVSECFVFDTRCFKK